ncbi:hypothetical protein AVEN_172481-1 [Araneus ventricosus]|uniref:Uncharacterized protein n=1 Tax=Araneus ventricosus TaxID=182803 RepID=A0A4Y2DRW1_ARAVE|nr:hypothetical protein AVEN_172481-1 [Araneus ventricosus]
MPSLFTFRATQPPEIGAMAKITLLHRVAYEKATPSSELTSLEMKIRNRHVESRLQKSLTELQILNGTGRTSLLAIHELLVPLGDRLEWQERYSIASASKAMGDPPTKGEE